MTATPRQGRLIAAYPGPLSDRSSPLSIGISGASGFVGSALSNFLKLAGHRVVPLKRGYGPGASEEARWWPEPDLSSLEGLEAVVHLAGESVAQFWTRAARERIYFSRVEGTKRLCRALAELKSPPRTLISASAAGYYEQTLDHPVDESGPAGSGFLSQVCVDWEGATRPAEQAGIRVCQLRLGLVISPGGGLLKPQLPFFKLGLGPIMGDGQQMQSFIDLDDLVGAIYHLLHTRDVRGPVNGTAPNPLSQAEFAQTLARACGARQWLRLPEAPFRMLLKDQAGMLFEGVAALPKRLLESGYVFCAPTFSEALDYHLG